MFEGVLYQLLAGYLGHYVKDIQREQFRIGLWSGEALLENVELRLEAFDYLQLPFSIKQGTVKKLKFQVPWQKLGWEPIVIALEDVTILAGPHEESEWNAESSERRALAAKKAALAAAEISKLSQRVSEDKSGETFLSYLSAKIIDNVQVTVSNVHVQYVDSQTDSEALFSFGITLSSFAITTTDGRDHPTVPSMPVVGRGVSSPVHKLVEIKELAVYWNSDKEYVRDSGRSVGKKVCNNLHSVLGAEDGPTYLLRPTNATMRLMVDKNATVKGGGPHYSVVVEVDDLSLALADRQLQQILMVMDVLSVSRLRERYARFRPSTSRADFDRSGAGWQRRLWIFAIQAVISDVRRHRREKSWNRLPIRSERQQHYVSLYKEKLELLQRVQPAGDQKFAELEEMEMEFEMDEILFLRSVVENQLQLGSDVFVNAASEQEISNGKAERKEGDLPQQPTHLLQQPLNQQRGWLNWLSLGLLGAAESIDAAVFPDEIIKDLCEAADFNPTSVIESGNPPKGWCRLILSVRVGEALGILRSSGSMKDIVSISSQRCSVTLTSWLDSMSVNISVPTLEVVDLCTSGSQFPRLLAPKAKPVIWSSSSGTRQPSWAEIVAGTGRTNSTTENQSDSRSGYSGQEITAPSFTEQFVPLITVEVTMRNKSQDFGTTVNVSIQPVEFVYSPNFIDHALNFFSQPTSFHKRQELIETSSEYGCLKAEPFSDQQQLGWHIDVQNTTFLFPENNLGTEGVLMVWAWDSLVIASTELQSMAASSVHMETIQGLQEDIGSNKQLEISFVGVQVIIATQISSWQDRLNHDADPDFHLLERFNLQVAACLLSMENTAMASWKISGEISSLQMHVSPSKSMAITAVLAQIQKVQKRTQSDHSQYAQGILHTGVGNSPNEAQLGDPKKSEKSPKREKSCGFDHEGPSTEVNLSDFKTPALEVNLNVKAVTVQLIMDEDSGPALQLMTLVAQMQDTTIRYTFWNHQKEEFLFRVNRFHIEDANEITGNSLPYLLFFSEGSSNTSKKSVKISTSSSQQSMGKASFIARLSSQKMNGARIMRLNLYLQGVECHCYPKVMRALYKFATVVTEARPQSAGDSDRKHGRYPLGESTYRLPEESKCACVEADLKMRDGLVSDPPFHIALQLKDLIFHLYDQGGLISSLVLADAALSAFDVAPADDRMKVVATAREIRLKGPTWASGNTGGDILGNASNGPAATLNVTLTKLGKQRSISGPLYNVVEVDAGLLNAQCVLSADYFAILVGYCMGPEWKFYTEAETLSDSKLTGNPYIPRSSSKNIYVVRMEIRDSVLLLPRESGYEEYMKQMISKMFISFTPAELAENQADGSMLLGSASSLIGSPNVDVLHVECCETALVAYGLQQFPKPTDGEGLLLIERIDGEMTVQLPTSKNAGVTRNQRGPTINAEMDLAVLVLNLSGNVSTKGFELLKVYLKELSSISWKYKTYMSASFRHGIRERSPFSHLKDPSPSDSPFNMTCSIAQLNIFIKAFQEPSLNVAVLHVENLNLSGLVFQGAVETLKVELLSAKLLHVQSSKKLVHIFAGDGDGEHYGTESKLIQVLFLANEELNISLPRIEVRLHMGAWNKVVPAIVSCFASSAREDDGIFEMTALSSPYVPSKVEDLGTPYPMKICPGSPTSDEPVNKGEASQFDGDNHESSDIVVGVALHPESNIVDLHASEKWPLLLKVGIFNAIFILPDFEEEVKLRQRSGPFRSKEKESTRSVLWRIIGSDTRGSLRDNQADERQNVEIGKQILFSFSVRIDELQSNKEGEWTISACITQTEGMVEDIFAEGQAFHMPFLQATEIAINGQVSLQKSPLMNLAFSVEVDSVDVWFSYAMIHFLSNFHFEPLKTGSSTATEFFCNLEVQVQSCSLLLSDSRWSCNAPNIEVIMRKVLAQVALKRLEMEASLSSELEINYHNIQKVAWEPVVEPWSVCYKISRVHDSKSSLSRPYRTKVEVTSPVQLNVNITEALVQALSRAMDMLNDAWEDSNPEELSAEFNIRDSQSAESMSTRRFAPYWLQNDTGIALSYWLLGGAKNKDHDEETETTLFSSARRSWDSGAVEIVQPGCCVPLFVEEGPDEVFQRRRAGLATDGYNAKKILNMLQPHRRICVQLEGTARPSLPMSIDLVGSRSFEAVFSEDDSGNGGFRSSQGSFHEIESEKGESFHAPVIFEVTVQRYSKLVRLCSMVSIVNATSVGLELRFDLPFVISPKVMDPTLPGQVVALPVHLAETGRLRWRPLGNNYLWSEAQLLPNLLQLPESHLGFHRPVVCYPSHPSAGAFRCCITAENHPIPAAEAVAVPKGKGPQRYAKGYYDSRDVLGMGLSSGSEQRKGCMFWDITLKAPLVVKNCLPCSFIMKIESGAGIINRVSAPEGDSLFVYDIDTIHDLNLAILAPSFLPTHVKVTNATSTKDTGRNTEQDTNKVVFAEALILRPEVTSNASVCIEMETTLDMISGARELRISVPFWLYNCSHLNLAIMDGDIEVSPGREQLLEGGQPNDRIVGEIPLYSGGSRSFRSMSGLQVAMEAPQAEVTDTVVRRPSRTAPQHSRIPLFSESSSGKPVMELGKDPETLRREAHGISSEQEICDVEGCDNQICMYSPVHGTDASEPHLRARVLPYRLTEMGKDSAEIVWSRPFSLEPPGGISVVTIPQTDGNGAFVVAVISAPVLGSCAGKTNTITFRPRFVLANVSKQVLCYKQQGTDTFQRLERGKHSHLHWHDISREFLVSIRIDEHGWDWSGGFSPDRLGDTQVKVRNHNTGAMQMLRVEVSIVGESAGGAEGAGPAGGNLGTCLILISNDETGFMPYRIENFTLERLRFHQENCEKMENMLQPYSSCSYSWDEPCQPHRLVIEVPGQGPVGSYRLDEVKDYNSVSVSATTEKAERKWLVHVRAEGPTRVLSIVDATVHATKGLNGVEASTSGEEFGQSRQTAEPSSEVLEEFVVKLACIGFSIIDTCPQEVVFACAKELCLQFLQGQHQQNFKLDVAWFQVDNQLRYAVYPVMLSVAKPRPSVSTNADNSLPEIITVDGQPRGGSPPELYLDAAFGVSITRWRKPTGSVDCFQHIYMRLEPLRLELEERVVSCLLHLMESITWSAFTRDTNVSAAFSAQSWSVLKGSQCYGPTLQPFTTTPWKYDMVQVPNTNIVRFIKQVKRLEEYRCWAAAVAVERIELKSQQLYSLAKGRRTAYIEILHVAPIALSVSFSSAPWLAEEARGAATRSVLWMTGALLQRQVRALADVEGAPVHLRQLKLAHPLASWDVIWGMITRHYTRQLLQEVYKVLGSADVFGNPVGFVRSLASGMWEFVSAPATSFVQSPSQLVRGVAQGTRSLFTNTVFAFSNAATRMSRAARKGVTVFAMDQEYDLALEKRLQYEGSQETSVVNEFLEGLTGLLQAPIRGAERHGLPGMLSGAALGAVGVVARPVASILEVAGMTAQSIRNRSIPLQCHAVRVRLPRHVNEYSPLLVYSWERAVGQAVLLEAEGGRFKNEVYFTCMPLAQPGKFVLLTESRILRVSSGSSAETAAGINSVFGRKWHLELEAAIDDILHLDQARNEVSVLLGPPIRPLVRPTHQAGVSSKYTTRFTPFAHETFELVTARAADEVLVMLKLLQDQHRKARSKLLLASSTSLSSSDFLDLDRFF